MSASRAVQEGQYTTVVYSAIKNGKYPEAIQILEFERDNFPRSRAALSLLGHCYYMVGDFIAAAKMYEELIKVLTLLSNCVKKNLDKREVPLATGSRL
jgi:tetratricopeptide repeat protein 30